MSLPTPASRILLSSCSRRLLAPRTSSPALSQTRFLSIATGKWQSRRTCSVDRQAGKGSKAVAGSGSIAVQGGRRFSTTPVARHGHLDPPKPGEERRVTFIDKDGESHTFEVADGDNLLDIAQANDIEMEGACGGSCACSTCHVIVESEEYYDKMEEPDDDENDMLDLAFGLTETSRLGCQVKMSKELDGLVVRLPQMTRNMQASDFEEKR